MRAVAIWHAPTGALVRAHCMRMPPKTPGRRGAAATARVVLIIGRPLLYSYARMFLRCKLQLRRRLISNIAAGDSL
jgi:hypothetical protein